MPEQQPEITKSPVQIASEITYIQEDIPQRYGGDIVDYEDLIQGIKDPVGVNMDGQNTIFVRIYGKVCACPAAPSGAYANEKSSYHEAIQIVAKATLERQINIE